MIYKFNRISCVTPCKCLGSTPNMDFFELKNSKKSMLRVEPRHGYCSYNDTIWYLQSVPTLIFYFLSSKFKRREKKGAFVFLRGKGVFIRNL